MSEPLSESELPDSYSSPYTKSLPNVCYTYLARIFGIFRIGNSNIKTLCLLLSIVAFLGCADIPEELVDEANGKTFNYCVLDGQKMCLTGTFTHKDCNGKASDKCPYGSPEGCGGSVFSSSMYFCYDGNVYQKCDGMEYNPTTHICQGYVANPAKCGGRQYNPLEQDCCVSAGAYYPSSQFCSDNKVYDFCNGSVYNPENTVCCDNIQYSLSTHFCSSNMIYSKCGENTYSPSYQFCQSGTNAVKSLCGTETYTATEFCQSGTNVVLPLCGTQTYSSTQFCQSDNAVKFLCGTETYLETEGCCDNSKYTIATHFCQSGTNAILSFCGTQTYTSTQFCNESKVLNKCGGSSTYDPSSEFCSGNTVYNKCNGKDYVPAIQRCENNVIEAKCGTGGYVPSSSYFCVDGTPTTSKGTFTDSRDSKEYEYINIGTQTWMAENLNYNATGSKCYGDNTGGDSQNRCDTYGRLYNWSTAMVFDASCNSTTCSGQVNAKHRGICPSGWHIPSYEDWSKLIDYVESSNGCSSCAGTYLKSASGWNSGGNGEDSYGFSALPGGFGSSGGHFSYVGNLGRWWSASEIFSSSAYPLDMGYNSEYVGSSSNGKSELRSVRCVQD